jgi:hypothetical protein
MKRSSRRRKSKKLIAFIAVLVVIVAVAILELTNTTHLFHNTAVVRAPAKPITTLSTPKSTNNGVKTPSSSTLTQGNPTDENGQVPSNVTANSSDWSTSTSGVITVKLPTANQTIQSGTTITGTASVSQVQYRLTDNQVGVISQGPINVVGGNFTATISFKAYGNSGRLDVFTTDSTGKEFNEVQIPVNFGG